MKKFLKNLGLWIIIAMVIGIVVGVFMGPEASMFKPLGDLFIQLIKMLVVPLVLVSIISGASALGETKSAGLIGGLSIAFMIITSNLLFHTAASMNRIRNRKLHSTSINNIVNNLRRNAIHRINNMTMAVAMWGNPVVVNKIHRIIKRGKVYSKLK